MGNACCLELATFQRNFNHFFQIEGRNGQI